MGAHNQPQTLEELRAQGLEPEYPITQAEVSDLLEVPYPTLAQWVRQRLLDPPREAGAGKPRLKWGEYDVFEARLVKEMRRAGTPIPRVRSILQRMRRQAPDVQPGGTYLMVYDHCMEGAMEIEVPAHEVARFTRNIGAALVIYLYDRPIQDRPTGLLEYSELDEIRDIQACAEHEEREEQSNGEATFDPGRSREAARC